MNIVQVDLRNENNERLTTWLDFKVGLEAGKYVSLKDFKPEIRWKVITVYLDSVKDARDFDWHRKWTNNI